MSKLQGLSIMKKPMYSRAARTYVDANGLTGIRRVVKGIPQPTVAEIDEAIAKFNAAREKHSRAEKIEDAWSNFKSITESQQ